MDAYFGRALKNWAARKSPTPETRSRLLEAAAADAGNPPKVKPARRPPPFRHPQPQFSFGHLLMSNMHSHNITIISLRLT
jgi:hypothetical protein